MLWSNVVCQVAGKIFERVRVFCKWSRYCILKTKQNIYCYVTYLGPEWMNTRHAKHIRGHSQTTLTTSPPPSCVEIFYLIKVDKNKTFLDYLPTSSCKRSLWMPPYEMYFLFEILLTWPSSSFRSEELHLAGWSVAASYNLQYLNPS